MKRNLLIISFIYLCCSNSFAQEIPLEKETAYNAQSRSIIVPKGESDKIVIDGLFSAGEWDNALKFPISEKFDIYLMVDSGILFIGMKSADPLGMAVSEIYITSNDNEFYNLHSSAALGEGVISFGQSPKFKVNYYSDWEANFCKHNKVNYEKWVAEGKPLDDLEKYNEIFKKTDGREYRINLNKFTGTRLKMIAGLTYTQGAAKKNMRYPENASLKNSNDWVELILPSSNKQQAFICF